MSLKKIHSGFVVYVLRTIQFIRRNRSIDIFSLTGNLRKPYLSVRTFMSIEKATQRNTRLSVRTSTKKGTNILLHNSFFFDSPPVRDASHRSDEVEPRPEYDGRLNLPGYQGRGATSSQQGRHQTLFRITPFQGLNLRVCPFHRALPDANATRLSALTSVTSCLFFHSLKT